MMAVTFDDRKWKKFITKIDKTAKRPQKVLRTAFSVVGFRDVINHFKQERGPQGRWAPLKTRKGKMLQDTGNLRNNFQPGNLENKGKDSFLLK